MIIRQAEIQKFGKLEKEQYRFSPQINIIYGPNESGKSTLMQFLKAMMYGLEKSRVRKTLDTYKKYEPWDAPAYFAMEWQYPYYLLQQANVPCRLAMHLSKVFFVIS